ncbi:RNA polymerase II subunit Rpb12 [Giardia muris]|uniref:RNA polymerase II subunit Rpb12 n=1 Tax=Giardia muris TaxID=5742 RepID=A0A4Z1SXY8_GIAMU|nr:RNA polymerase II subunit Rpb12 [Giardia muris]|eukprot:TNJ29675.1 RNA polymerase II subunit Rpb12 [Giardia muris]
MEPIVYICAICGTEVQLSSSTAVACSANPAHKVLYKKRARRPLIYKAI